MPSRQLSYGKERPADAVFCVLKILQIQIVYPKPSYMHSTRGHRELRAGPGPAAHAVSIRSKCTISPRGADRFRPTTRTTAARMASPPGVERNEFHVLVSAGVRTSRDPRRADTAPVPPTAPPSFGARWLERPARPILASPSCTE